MEETSSIVSARIATIEDMDLKTPSDKKDRSTSVQIEKILLTPKTYEMAVAKTGSGGYITKVNFVKRTASCTCLDFQHRGKGKGVVCKHVAAVVSASRAKFESLSKVLSGTSDLRDLLDNLEAELSSLTDSTQSLHEKVKRLSTQVEAPSTT